LSGEGKIVEGDFILACRFFRELTGIKIQGDPRPSVDFYPVKNLPDILVMLRAWHDLHQGELYWNEDEQRVVVKPKYFLMEAWRWLF
jgi:hypothetical protein